MNNERNLMSLYNVLYREMNTLKDKVDRLEKGGDTIKKADDTATLMKGKKDGVPQFIVTDVYAVGSTLKVVRYDRRADRSLTKSINFGSLEDEADTVGAMDAMEPSDSKGSATEQRLDELNKLMDADSSTAGKSADKPADKPAEKPADKNHILVPRVTRGTPITVENVAEEINKIFKSNPLNNQ
jgi:hypothetical protein